VGDVLIRASGAMPNDELRPCRWLRRPLAVSEVGHKMMVCDAHADGESVEVESFRPGAFEQGGTERASTTAEERKG